VAQLRLVMPNPRMSDSTRPTIGVIAVLMSFIALLSALVGPIVVHALYPPLPPEHTLAKVIVDVRDAVKSRLQHGSPTPPPQPRRFDRAELPYDLSMAFAGLAIVAGCTSFLRREDQRYAYVACGVASVSLAWYALLLAIAAVIVCAIIFAVVWSLGGS